MIAVELIRRSRSAEAIGPRGSSMPAGSQEVRRVAALTAGQRSRRERRGPCSNPVPLIGASTAFESKTDLIAAAAHDCLHHAEGQALHHLEWIEVTWIEGDMDRE
jgi:flavin-binding protein dodecin